MSSALGIAGVTAVLKSMLSSVFNNSANLGSVAVTALAPDVVQAGLGSSSAYKQINLFLHQVTHNAAWRNAGLPQLGADGKTVLKNPPLALDLHYLLTAYTPEDGFAEALLGFALLTLHQFPAISRDQITSALSLLPSDPLTLALQASGLAEQVELLKITPDPLGREEMAWIWTALKADYRPSYAFQVSVVLLQQPATVASPLPVFSRNITVQAGPPPVLLQVEVPDGQAGAAQKDTVTLTGQSLQAMTRVRLRNQRFGVVYDLVPASVAGTALSFVVPDDATAPPAGVYMASALITDSSGMTILQSTNSLTLALLPTITGFDPPPASSAGGTLVNITLAPPVLPAQNVTLALAGTAVPAPALSAPASQLSFLFPQLASGTYLARVQVDGADSPVKWAAPPAPPAFTAPLLTVP